MFVDLQALTESRARGLFEKYKYLFQMTVEEGIFLQVTSFTVIDCGRQPKTATYEIEIEECIGNTSTSRRLRGTNWRHDLESEKNDSAAFQFMEKKEDALYLLADLILQGEVK